MNLRKNPLRIRALGTRLTGLIGLMGLMVLPGLSAGCAPVTPNYDAKFGMAVREAKLAMTISPDAGTVPDLVAGLDGKSAREALIHYQNTFKLQPPAVNVINLGGNFGR
jgi:hypothetical protein